MEPNRCDMVSFMQHFPLNSCNPCGKVKLEFFSDCEALCKVQSRNRVKIIAGGKTALSLRPCVLCPSCPHRKIEAIKVMCNLSL